MEAEALTDWLYQRFVEKEELLAHFYEKGLDISHKSVNSLQYSKNTASGVQVILNVF